MRLKRNMRLLGVEIEYIIYALILMIFSFCTFMGIVEGLLLIGGGIYNIEILLFSCLAIPVSLFLSFLLEIQKIIDMMIQYNSYKGERMLRKMCKRCCIWGLILIIIGCIFLFTISIFPMISGISFIILNLISIFILTRRILGK